ncbi:hypothetical protein GOP47_0012147 [Adiantum capillus-veneris]|uniref:Uncharacterized protein n=1 Tax=Adiantum capillus-veneris TaxID=13818 RepID=A0A9D4ZGL7_ADICA|nr:hypothetical protein GOP47_0012147 [Adiantum capillus-veneris]
MCGFYTTFVHHFLQVPSLLKAKHVQPLLPISFLAKAAPPPLLLPPTKSLVFSRSQGFELKQRCSLTNFLSI